MSHDGSLQGSAARGGNRVRIFIDFWNLQITMNERLERATGISRFNFDWDKLPKWLVRKAGDVCSTSLVYEGMHVYASHDPLAADQSLKRWLQTWLDRQPGVQVVLKERRPRNAPKCPACHQIVPNCPHCKATLSRTEEKGVDTAIVTDMIRLAWEEAYDVAILVSSDSDLVPAVQFLDLRGRKMIQAGFPPTGAQLATACWASFDLFKDRQEFVR